MIRMSLILTSSVGESVNISGRERNLTVTVDGFNKSRFVVNLIVEEKGKKRSRHKVGSLNETSHLRPGQGT